MPGLELGFQVNAGPLSQVSVQIFSMETAVHLAVGAYGWLKARNQADSLNAILEARMARLAPLSTFNLQKYTSMRQRHPLFGVARQNNSDLASVELPVASSSQYGVPGLCCLYALVTALLCFFDQKTVLFVLMEILPEHLLHYDQEGVRLSKEPGPLSTAVRALIAAVAKEETNSRATQSLLRGVDGLRLSLGSTPQCDIPKNNDSREVCGFLEWLAAPYSKRKHQLYPTRSFLVWCLADACSNLGFDIHVSRNSIQTEEQYAATFDNIVDAHEMTVYFVPVSVGKTDPYIRKTGPCQEIPPPSIVRLVPIRTIPFLELGQHLSQDSGFMERLSRAWNYTFKHFQNNSPDSFASELSYHQKSALEAFNDDNLEFGRVSLVYQYLKRPIAKYIKPACPDCTSHRRDSVTETSHPRNCWSDPTHHHNQRGKLMLKVIYVAAAYSLACRYVEDERGPADLDTEVAYVPSRTDDITGFLSLEPPWHAWFMDHYHIFRPYDCDHEELFANLAQAICCANVYHTSDPLERFGCHANGLTLLSKFLLDPLGVNSTHRFSLRFGQPVDFPVHDGLILSRKKPTHLRAFTTQVPPTEPLQIHDVNYTDMVRWDMEPDWEDCELDIHYQCRTQGIANLSIPLPLMRTSLLHLRPTIQEHSCHDRALHLDAPTDHTSLLSEYEKRLSCHILPYKSLRQQGYSRIILEPRRRLWRVGKPTVVILETFREPAEQWLALYTECQATQEIPYPNVRRILSPCLRCGLAAASATKPLLDTFIILVVTS